MRYRLTLLAAATCLALTACGGSSDQDEVADLIIEQASGEVELDEDCVRDTTAKLSDEDAAALVEAGVDGDPEVSDEANAIADEIGLCVDVSSYRDGLIDTISEGDETIDADCLRDALGDLETAAEIDDAVLDAAFDCSSG